MSRDLQVGDVVANVRGSTTYFYVVTGFSPRGKTLMRRGWTGTELSCWWPTEDSLPKNYYVHARAPEEAAA